MKKLSIFSLLLMMKLSLTVASTLIPNNDSSLYYQIGGGQDIPLPAYYDTTTIPLSVHSDIGLGFNCGLFNPKASLTNSLNQIKSSFINVKQQVLANATAAVTEFPLYEIARADPDLYNLLTDQITDARADISISTKSCQTMQSQIAAGQNPYAHWGQISAGDHWQQEIGTAAASNNGDINQARSNVAHDNGKSGVPWVNPHNTMLSNSNDYRAGGENQPPIHVVQDTTMAGYHSILDNHGLHASNSESELKQVWPTAKDAASWLVDTVGDETITTYDSGQKSSKPGVGLYKDIETIAKTLQPKLQNLVSGSTSLTVKNLQAISPEGVGLSPDMIHSIQNQPKLMQSIIVNKLAQNIAAMAVINKARLAMRILQSGQKIPAIYSNQAAQKLLEQSMTALESDVQHILLFIKARQSLMTNLLTTIANANEASLAKNNAIAVPTSNGPILQQGAIAKPAQ